MFMLAPIANGYYADHGFFAATARPIELAGVALFLCDA